MSETPKCPKCGTIATSGVFCSDPFHHTEHEWPCEQAPGGAGRCEDSNCPASRPTPEYLRERWRVRIDNEPTSGGEWSADERAAFGMPAEGHRYAVRCALVSESGYWLILPQSMGFAPLLSHIADVHNEWLDRAAPSPAPEANRQ